MLRNLESSDTISPSVACVPANTKIPRDPAHWKLGPGLNGGSTGAVVVVVTGGGGSGELGESPHPVNSNNIPTKKQNSTRGSAILLIRYSFLGSSVQETPTTRQGAIL